MISLSDGAQTISDDNSRKVSKNEEQSSDLILDIQQIHDEMMMEIEV